jgi:hypothetical protein
MSFMLPRLMVVTKLDKEHSDIGIALDSAHNVFKEQSSLHSANRKRTHTSKAWLMSVHMKAYQFDEHGKAKEIPTPDRRPRCRR